MELLPEFRLARPSSVDEALDFRRGHSAARYLSGGTDLIPNMRRGLVDAPLLIDLSGVAELGTIEATDGGLAIGSAVTLAELARHAVVARDYQALAQAAGSVAGPTQREMGTVGGNLCLDTRCYFYNQSEWWRRGNDYCLKYRGEICHVVPTSKRCYAAYSGDLAPALLIFDTEVDLAGPEGRRRLPLEQLFTGDGADYLALDEGELVATVRVDAPRTDFYTAYGKLRVRGSVDFPLAGVAVGIARRNGALSALRVALTGTNPGPLLLAGTDDLLGRAVDESVVVGLEKLIQQQTSPVRTSLTQPQYRRRAIAAVACRLLRQLAAT